MNRALLICAVLIVAYSCTKPTPTPTPSADLITIPSSENTSPTFATEGGTASVSFTASGAWTASVINTRADGWCTVSPTSGASGSGSITINASVNDTNDERSATVQIKCGTAEKTITATQKQKDALTVTKSRFDIGSTGGDVQIEVKSNISFEYRIEDDAKSWVSEAGTKAMSTKTLNFKVAENEENEKREGTITVFSGKLSEKIKIYQEGAKPTIVLSQSEYAVKAEGETIQVEVRSNVNVTATIKSGADWVSEVSTKAMSTNTFYYAVAANESYDSRVAEIEFTNTENGLSEKVTITQVQKDAIVVAKNSYNVDNKGGNIEIEVAHNVDFDVEIADSWLSLISTKSYTTDKLVFTIEENTTTDNRETKITFTSKDKSITQDVKICQAQTNSIVVSETEKAVSAEGGTFEVELKHNVEFEVIMPDVDWLSIVETKSMASTTKTFNVSKNETYDPRSAKIIFKSIDGSLSETITVSQMQKGSIIVAKTEYEFDRMGGEFSVDVNHSITYKTIISDDWITEVSTKVLETTQMKFSVAQNNSGQFREGTICFKSDDEKISQTIVIKQSNITTIVISEKLLIFSPEGGSKQISINPSVKFDYDINEGNAVNWIQSSSINESVIHIKTSANESYDERVGFVYVTDIESTKVDTIKIVQRSSDTYIIDEIYECSYKEGTISIDFKTNVDYSVKIKDSPDWISVVETKALAPSSITFSCRKNESADSRTAVVQFTNSYGECSKEITIKQYSSRYIGDYIIDSEEDAQFFDKYDFEAIDGDLTVKDIISAASLNNKIHEVNGTLTLTGLSNFDGFYELKHISGDLNIEGHTWKKFSTEGLNNLYKVDGNVTISGDYDKNAFKGLASLSEIGGNLTLTVPSNSLRITVPFTGLENLKTVGGDVKISYADDLTGLKLSNLKSLTLNKVNSFVGLESLKEITNDLTIINSEAESFAGFNNLEKIGGNFNIRASIYSGEAFSKISSFSGFDNLKEIGLNFDLSATISNNGGCFHSLTSLSGLNSLTIIHGDFIISTKMYSGKTSNGATAYNYAFNNNSSVKL